MNLYQCECQFHAGGRKQGLRHRAPDPAADAAGADGSGDALPAEGGGALGGGVELAVGEKRDYDRAVALMQDYNRQGAAGNAAAATAEKGQVLLDASGRALAQLLGEIDRLPPDTLRDQVG